MFALGALEFGVGWLISIQNTVICFCNVKPLIILCNSVHVGWRQLLEYLTKE